MMRPSVAAAFLIVTATISLSAAPPARSSAQKSPPQPGGSATATAAPQYLNVKGAGATTGNAVAQEEQLPTTVLELLTELAARMQSVEKMIEDGDLGAVWYPAIRSKDIVLSLEENHLGDLPPAQRAKTQSAVKRLTLAAWQIDAAGDLGDKKRLLALYQDFSKAIAEIQSVYETK
jgi:hypothetical protein